MTESNTSDRVLIVGAGAAGLTMAMNLREKGYNHVVVVEKTPEVGGKCHSLAYKGRNYDMGANLTTPRYETIRPLAARLNLDLISMAERRLIALTDEAVPSPDDFSTTKAVLLRALSQWYILMRNRSGVAQNGYAGIGKGARKPFKKWLKSRGLAPFRELFANLFIAYGYGIMDELPAAYALKFFDEVHMTAAVDTILGKEVTTTKVFADGFNALWVKVVEAFEIDVRLSVDVKTVTRDDAGVHATWTTAEGDTVSQDFDRLVLACGPDRALSFLDATAEELRLFAQLERYDYYVTAAVLKGVPDISTFLFPYSKQFNPGKPTVFYPPFPGDSNNVFMFYAYGDKHTNQEIVHAHIREVIARPEFEGELVEIIATKHWKYFPHVNSRAMKQGFYEDMEALQGVNRTYIAGEAMSFTLVELIARYSEDLVKNHF